MKIIVINERKMSEYFNVKVENGQDLMMSDNEIIKEFIKKYTKIFTTSSSEEIYDFLKKWVIFYTRFKTRR